MLNKISLILAVLAATGTSATPPDYHGRSWVLMVRQTKGFWFTPALAASGQYNTDNPSAPNYLNLVSLEKYRKDGAFTMTLKWPGMLEQTWNQTSNPFTRKDSGVTGYSEILVSYKDFWGGMEWNGKECILDGSPDHPYFFYEVGAFTPFQGAIAGPLTVVDKVELYVLGDVSTTPSHGSQSPQAPQAPQAPQTPQRPTYPQSGTTHPSKFFWPCRVMSQEICVASPQCVFTSSLSLCECRDHTADFVFALDSSSQVGTDGFAFEKDLLSMMMLNLPKNSRVAVMTSDKKGDLTHTPQTAMHMQGNSESARMSVDRIEYANGHIGLSDIVTGALSIFESSSSSRKMKQLVLLVGGKDMGSGNPCVSQTKLRSMGVGVIVVGVGDNFDAGRVQCLVENGASSGVVKAKMWNSQAFSQAWGAINNLICPLVSA